MLLGCFGLRSVDDNRAFCKLDLVKLDTVNKLRAIVDDLAGAYYTPCTAKVYLKDVTDRRAITILKQVLRKHDFTLLSRERNLTGKKVIFYQVIRTDDVHKLYRMTKNGDDMVWVSFDA